MDYVSELKYLWKEIDRYRPIMIGNIDGEIILLKYIDKYRICKFFVNLNINMTEFKPKFYEGRAYHNVKR